MQRLRRTTIAALFALTGAMTACATLPHRDGLRASTLERLYLGRNIGDTGVVSDSAWRIFVRDVVTPAFPEGATVFEAAGQWRAPDGVIVRERTFVLELLHPVAGDADQRVQSIIAEYKRRFAQQSVLRIAIPVRLTFF